MARQITPGWRATLTPIARANQVLASQGRRCGLIRWIRPSGSSSNSIASSILNGPTRASAIMKPRSPSMISSVQRSSDSAVDRREQQAQILLAPDHAARKKRRDKLGVGRQRVHQPIDIIGFRCGPVLGDRVHRAQHTWRAITGTVAVLAPQLPPVVAV